MKKSFAFALIALSTSSAFAGELPLRAPELLSFGTDIHCISDTYVVAMHPRAPRAEENAPVIAGRNEIQGKVDVTIVNRSNDETVASFVADDSFDSHEAAIAGFSSEENGFRFFSESQGEGVVEYSALDLGDLSCDY